MTTLTPKSKNLIKIAVGILLLGGVFVAWKGGYMDTTKVTESTAVNHIELPSAGTSDNSAVLEKVAELTPPTKQATSIKALTYRMGQMQWEAQFAWLYCNGGINTTKGSLFEQANIKMNIVRQDNCITGVSEIVKCATAYKQDKNTSEGLHMYNVMFDGSGAFIKNLESQLAPLGNEYRPVIIPYFAGKSYGADAVWLPRTWFEKKDDGSLAVIKDSLMGSVISCVAKDGDWNVLVNLSSITQVPMNWNIGTYDPKAINVHNVSDYQLAADAAIADGGKGLEEVLTTKKGKGVSGKTTIRVRGFSSWSPEDQQAAEEVGGFVRALSTKEYDSQMPAATITFKKFVDDNRDQVVNMILALSQGADQIKSYRPAMKRAAEAAVDIYQNKDVSYFLAMYNGSPIKDAQGESVEVGGNRVMNLADNMEYWGLSDGSVNIASKVYKTYADIIANNYPEDMPGGPVAFNKVVDVTILQDAYDKSQTEGGNKFIVKAELADFSKQKDMKTVVGQANYQINFATGSASFAPGTEATLNQILNQGLIGSNTLIQINGHTDNVGDEGSNQTLSERRAQAVADWLKKQAPTRFTGYRVKTQGFGMSKPLSKVDAVNNSEAGRAKNRRVEVVIGTNE